MSRVYTCVKIIELVTGCSITAVSAAGGRRARDRHSAPRILIDISIFIRTSSSIHIVWIYFNLIYQVWLTVVEDFGGKLFLFN